MITLKRKVLRVHFYFICLDFFKWIHFSLYRYWKFIIWLIIANYCFFYFSGIGDYVLNWSNTSFPCFMNFKALGCASSFKVHKTWVSAQKHFLQLQHIICGIWKIFNNTRQRNYGLIIIYLMSEGLVVSGFHKFLTSYSIL